MLQQQELNGAVALVEHATNLMQRLTRLPTPPDTINVISFLFHQRKSPRHIRTSDACLDQSKGGKIGSSQPHLARDAGVDQQMGS